MHTVVTTRAGRVRGAEQPGLFVFRGIPYAASTAGRGRFRAPRAAEPWTGVRDALEPGPTAPQVLGLMRDLPPQSEDCLQLNVWAPRGESARRPVFVLVHGGGYTTGASTNAFYDAAELARRADAVVVSLNYRLGVLGFAYLGALSGLRSDANLGVRDVIAALGWVRDNVEGFGGDPDNVTVIGQSAGAMMASILLALPAARGLLHRAIAQSGGVHHVATAQDAASVTEAWLDALGIGPGGEGRLLELPFEALVGAQAACFRRWVSVGSRERPLPSPAMTLLPVVDGELIARRPIEVASQSELPLLTGTNRDEWNYWVLLADTNKRGLDAAGLQRVVAKRVGGRAEELIDVYRSALVASSGGGAPAPWRVFSALETDRQFRIPAIRLAEARSAPTFLYAFDWRSPLFDGEMGSCHSLEVPFVLGQTSGPFGEVFVGGGAAAELLSRRMIDAWGAFARGGDPACESLGSWPVYEARRATMNLSRTPGLVEAPDEERRAAWDSII